MIDLLEKCHSIDSNFPKIGFLWNVTFHAVLCSCTLILHVTLSSGGLHGHKMYRKWPEHLSSTLLTTAVEEKQTSHRLLFLFFLVFSGHDMNVFVTDLPVGNVVTHVQGFSSEILIIFFVRNCVKWQEIWSNVWLPFMVNVYNIGV